jgi:predicted nucleic acid-binding protein
MSQAVIIDANRLFSELIARSQRLRALFTSHPDVRFYCPKYVFVELFKHKEAIAAATKLAESDLLLLLNSLLQRINFFDEDAVSIGSWTEAWRLCRDVDENDTAYIALTLELNGLLWTGDKELEIGLRKKGFTQFFSSDAIPPRNRGPSL